MQRSGHRVRGIVGDYAGSRRFQIGGGGSGVEEGVARV